jgi:hypothetical protein
MHKYINTCTCIVTVSDTSTENNFSVQLVYDSTDSTLQCKFQGYVLEVVWYLILTAASIYLDEVYIRSDIVKLGLGNQYRQSTIQATDLENYYVNELTIVNGPAPFGLYYCVTFTDNSNYHSAELISTCKLKQL